MSEPRRLIRRVSMTSTPKTDHPIVSREQWLKARRDLLAAEKAFTKQRDDLNARRRALPWVRVEPAYTFDTPDGRQTLGDLFEDRSQLIIQHFMYGADWDDGCPSCSFWADSYNGVDIHLAHRDISFVVVSVAPLPTLQTYKKRMGWTFRWVSSAGTTFNRDFHVSFSPEELEKGEAYYNYGTVGFPSTEAPGASAFYRDSDGAIYHTYSCYARGLDILNGAYHYMDIAPKGRNEDGLPWPMAWLRRRDQYED